ncbi:MAG: ATP-binding cassette domain-containing protein [Phycisphaerae bacterium]
MLELNGVHKSFGSTVALRGVDLAVNPGTTTVVIGPSGCGKSTVLRLMIGILGPDCGTVNFEGSPITPENVRRVRHRMGYVIQDGGLFPHLTARMNLALVARRLGWDRRRIEARAEALAALTRFPMQGLDRYPAQLSGGQCQRVSLMRALMLEPHVLLLDEPLGALDPMIRAELQADLKQVFQTLRSTVVMVTHDIGEAGFFSDTILLMRNGAIVQKGTLETLVHRPEDPFVTRFINAQRSPLESLGKGAS